MPSIIGLPGNIACGKTVVEHMLLELGTERYIDADAVVHTLYLSWQPIAVKVVETFGPAVVAADGSIDRKALGVAVFQDAEAMRRLESIVHSAVSIANELASVSASGIAIIDAVKLLEGGSGAFCQSKWLVICPEEQEIALLLARNQLSEEEAWSHIRAQPPVANKLALVDVVIDNSGSLEQTRHQVVAAFECLCRRFPA